MPPIATDCHSLFGILTELLQTAEDVAHQTPAVQRARQRRTNLLETVHVQDALGTALHDMTSAEACTEVEQLLALIALMASSDCTDGL